MPNTPAPRPSTPVAPAARPLPIQLYNLEPEDFSANTARFNVLMSQIVTAVHALQGVAGPSVLPSGVDVAGSSVTGLAPPQDETDAVSLGHANSQYGYAAQQGQLDIGAPYALKGLTGLWMKFNNLPAIPSTGSGSNANGYWFNINGLLIQFNGPVSFIGSADYPVTYPTPFTVIGVPVMIGVSPSGNFGYSYVIEGTQTLIGFSVHQANTTGNQFNWIAVGM